MKIIRIFEYSKVLSMATIKFLLQSKSDNAPIYLRLSISRGKILYRKTGLFINPKEWSESTGLPKQNNPDNKNLSTDLRDLKSKILKDLNKANSKGVEVSGDWLINKIDLHFKRISQTSQSEYITDVIQNMRDTAEVRKNGKGGIGLSKSRINSYNSLDNMIVDYQKEKKFKVKDVNIKFANDFLKYLIKEKKYSKNYSLKKISDLKTVCYYAELEGIETSQQLKKIESAKGKNENVIYLSPLELEKIKKAKLVNPALQNACKWLLLGCNIGQRGGDLLNLTEGNFITRNGLEVIELEQQKTGKNVTIPVLKTTREILETGLPYKISLQKFNDYIKEICFAAGITEETEGAKICMVDKEGKIIPKAKNGSNTKKGVKRTMKGAYKKYELVSSHICRRSFATNQYGVLPTPLIMRITAHSTEKMFLNYIGKNSLDYAQQIADFYTLQEQKEKNQSKLTVVKKASNNN